MLPRETGKARAARIPYDYARGPDRLIRWRLRATLAAAAVLLAWLAWGWIDADASRLRASHGPLARAHSTWETRCDACHVAFPDVRAAGWERSYSLRSEAGDRKCQACHMGQPDQGHHALARAGTREEHCVSCHGDHAGRDAALVRRDEGQCTACHRDLGQGPAAHPIEPPLDPAIAHFADGSHPDFRSLARPDPGRIKFNHALHMSKGIKWNDKDANLAEYRHLDATDRPRCGGTPGMAPDAPVQLECGSCHRPDGTGRSMAPIAYQRDCAACHGLDVPAPGGTIKIRHGVQPDLLHDELTARLTSLLLAEDPGVLDDRTPRRLPVQRARVESARRAVETRVAAVERHLFGPGKQTCTECHYYTTRDRAPRADGAPLDVASIRVEPARIPAKWFQHADFDHAAHQAVECRSCHAPAHDSGKPAGGSEGGSRTLRNGKATWTSHEDILIAGIASCVECHAPPSRARGRPTGGAGVDCVECHTYHFGEPSGAGRASGGPARDILHFLRGQP